MGIEAVWRTEAGDELDRVGDPQSRLSHHVTQNGHAQTICLRFLNPYGDACFNQLQIPVLAEELEAAADQVDDTELREHLRAVARLAHRVRQANTYLWFVGD